MFNALYLTQKDGKTVAEIRPLEDAALPPGDVTVRVEYSSLNFKDALAVTGHGPVVRKWPLVAGIDLAGTVEASTSDAWKPGDRVVVNGWGMGETDWGGFAQKARLPEGWPLRLRPDMTTRSAAAIGTAGYTAALCVMALLKHGLKPADGPVLVTGASGGVGSVAVALLSGLGYSVAASTGKLQEAGYLRQLGATDIIARDELSVPGKPLQRERWAGTVDTLGSHTLANACAATRWNGAVAACGLAQGGDFTSSVMPFILRGVTLYGINCVFVDNATRARAYDLLADHVLGSKLDEMTSEIGLSEVSAASQEMIDGRRKGRTVIAVDR